MSASFVAWEQKLRRNQEHRPVVAWDQLVCLTPTERQRIATSLREFQLGETGQGSHLFRCAERWVQRTQSENYVPALRVLFSDEARHADELGRYMDLAGIPRQRQSTLNHLFRRIRKLAGIEVMVATLLVGELVGMVYYRALRDATNCSLLRDLCKAMLADESMHVGFQASLLQAIDAERQPWLNTVTRIARRVLCLGSGAAVWVRHRGFFRAAGFGCRRYLATLGHQHQRALAVAAVAART